MPAADLYIKATELCLSRRYIVGQATVLVVCCVLAGMVVAGLLQMNTVVSHASAHIWLFAAAAVAFCHLRAAAMRWGLLNGRSVATLAFRATDRCSELAARRIKATRLRCSAGDFCKNFAAPSVAGVAIGRTHSPIKRRFSGTHTRC